MTDPTSRWVFPDDISEVHFLDYETRARADLSRVGVSIYASEAEVLLTAVCRDDSDPIVVDDFEAPEDAVVISWGIFDFHIYRALNVRPALWIDASAIARYVGLPSGLDACGKILGFGRKDPEGERLIRRYTRPGPATGAFQELIGADRAESVADRVELEDLLEWKKGIAQ